MNDEFEIDLPPKAYYIARLDTHLCPKCFDLYEKEVGPAGRSINDCEVYFPSDVPTYKLNIDKIKSFAKEAKENIGLVPIEILNAVDMFPMVKFYAIWCAKCRTEVVLGKKLMGVQNA